MVSHGLDKDQLKLLRETLAPFVEQIEKVGLFGSRATGTFRPNSDIDMVIYGLVDKETEAHMFTILNEISLPFKVDVQAYNNIVYPPLKKHIDAVMLPLFTHEQLL